MHDDAVTGRCEFLLFKYFALKNEYISLYLYISWGFKRKQLYIYMRSRMLQGTFKQETSHIIDDTFSACNICKGRIF